MQAQIIFVPDAVISVYLLYQGEITQNFEYAYCGDPVDPQKICDHLLADFFLDEYFPVVRRPEAVGEYEQQVADFPGGVMTYALPDLIHRRKKFGGEGFDDVESHRWVI
jgi:hypothetical protein